MKPWKFKAEFINGEIEFVHAWVFEEAIILAMAEQIKKGNDYTLLKIVNVEKDIILFPKVIFTA